MTSSIIRILFAIEFLLALIAVFAFWSQVGGQYHLDLMYWPWKFGLGLGAAAVFTFLTAEFVRKDGRWSRRAFFLVAVLFAVVLTAGAVTYYYHLNEPDESDTEDTPVRNTPVRTTPVTVTQI